MRLSPAEQSLLRKALDDVSSQKKAVLLIYVSNYFCFKDYVGISQEQARSLFIVNALPFVGFGFLDNMIMILAGEYIDQVDTSLILQISHLSRELGLFCVCRLWLRQLLEI